MKKTPIKHHALKDFVQFEHDPLRPKEAGSGGWGFDIEAGEHEYRIVVYAPESFDINATESSVGSDNKTTSYRDTLGINHVFVKTRNGWHEHGPAHVHVIDKKTGRESKFELIEHLNSDSFEFRVAKLFERVTANANLANNIQTLLEATLELPLTPTSLATAITEQYSGDSEEQWRAFLGALETQMGSDYPRNIEANYDDSHYAMRLQRKNATITPLSPQQVDEVLPIVKSHVPEFIQLWREAYEETTLATQVTRVSEVFPDYLARIQDELDESGNATWTVKLKQAHNNSKHIAIPLEEYVDLPPRQKKAR